MHKWNAYDIAIAVLSDAGIRADNAENVVKGTRTTEIYSVAQVKTAINAAVQWLYSKLVVRIPEQFLEGPDDLAFTSSVATLPWNFGRLLWLRDADGYKVQRIQPHQRRLEAYTGSNRLYMIKGNTIVLDQASVTATYKLYYTRRPRVLDFGKATAGGALSITLPTSARKTADYYNGMEIENKTSDWIDTIDDYSTARVATISETAAADDYYGLVPEIPEPFHYLIPTLSTLYMTGNFPIAKSEPGKGAIEMFNAMLQDALSAYASPPADENPDSLFVDYNVGPQMGWYLDV